MRSHEKIVTVFARVATVAFVALNFATFSGIYGWLHPALWAVSLLCFLVLEGAFYYIRGSRPKVDMAVALAMWTSLGAWLSFEHFTVLLSAILVLRAVPDGWALRVAALILAGGIGSLVTLADINPWSSAPGKPWLHDLFFASCLVNMLLVFARASLPERRTS